MKLGSIASRILTNKMVLNVVSIIALLNVIGYVVMGDVESVAVFIVLAILVRYFSKNMIVVLGIPLIIVNMMALKNRSYGIEGLEAMPDSDKKAMPAADNNAMPAADKKAMPAADNQMMSDDDKKKAAANKKKDADAAATITGSNDKPADHFEVGRAKNGGAKIDYAATVEGAYDELNKILGSEGMKSLTDDTQRLMKQQAELAKTMETFGPMMQQLGPIAAQAQEMMKSMKMDGDGGIASLMKMAQNIGAGAKA
jgi:hypothetical protein